MTIGLVANRRTADGKPDSRRRTGAVPRSDPPASLGAPAVGVHAMRGEHLARELVGATCRTASMEGAGTLDRGRTLGVHPVPASGVMHAHRLPTAFAAPRRCVHRRVVGVAAA